MRVIRYHHNTQILLYYVARYPFPRIFWRDSTAPSFPKLVSVLREGYGLSALRADAVAGLTVAIVALPLSMAIAIASGTTPERGLFTAIIGGFLISALGGSRFQVGGPAGAFIVLVAATVARHGIEGMLLATLMAGVFLVAAGALRLGTFVKFIPYPVTVGFTTGIAVIIFGSQIKDLFGLTLQGKEPGEFAAKLEVLAGAAGTVNAAAVALAVVDHRYHRRPPKTAPALAGHADRRRGHGSLATVVARPADRDDRQPFRRHPVHAAGPQPARHVAGEDAGRAAGCRSPSRCWAPSSLCSPRLWPTA